MEENPVELAPAVASSDATELESFLVNFVVEQTGYPAEVVELDADLEADLGVDTVKQAETFAAIREEWSIPFDENLALRDYPTLQHAIQFVYDKRPDLQAAPEPAAPGEASAPAAAAEPAAAGEDAVLWLVTNEPMLAFENLRAPDVAGRPTDLVHYPADEIKAQIDLLYGIDQDENVAGMALVMSSDKQQAGRNVLPSLTLAMNTLAPGAVQRAHKHNSVAVSLVIQGEKCFSMIDGERKDWAPWATTISPSMPGVARGRKTSPGCAKTCRACS